MGPRRKRPRPSQMAKMELDKAIRVPNANREQWQPIARDLEIYNRYCDGQHTMRELATEYKIHHVTLWEIIHKVENWLVPKFIMEIRELRVRATTRLEMIYAKAMQSYARSLEDEETITETETDKGITVTKQRKGQAGSPAFLAQARECISDMLDIWGGKAPKVVREIHSAMRVGGKSPQEALQSRLEHLQTLISTTSVN